MRAAKVQVSLRIRAVSQEPLLLAHTSSESRGTFRQKARSLAPLNDWASAVKICHDGMLEDTNLLGAPYLLSISPIMFLLEAQTCSRPQVVLNPTSMFINAADRVTSNTANLIYLHITHCLPGVWGISLWILLNRYLTIHEHLWLLTLDRLFFQLFLLTVSCLRMLLPYSHRSPLLTLIQYTQQNVMISHA